LEILNKLLKHILKKDKLRGLILVLIQLYIQDRKCKNILKS